MCRSGHEGGATTARRCEVPEHRRKSHNATRMMRRISSLMQNPALSDQRRSELRDAFMQHCDSFRTVNGLGPGEYPPVPASVSLVSHYTPGELDRLPYEVLDQRAMDASQNGDWAACEVICLEIERREDLTGQYPREMEAEERRRWAALQAAERREMVKQLDPVTHPAVRDRLTAKQIEKAARAEYETYIELAIMDAEEAVNNVFYNRAGMNALAQGKGPTLRAMWTNHIFASAYASEELRRYWSDNPRLTYAAWQEMVSGRFGQARESVLKSSLTVI